VLGAAVIAMGLLAGLFYAFDVAVMPALTAAKTAGWIVAGLAFYTVTLVVTIAFHFPLNNELKEAGDPARIENLAAVREHFLTPWVAWNIVRTLASTAAFGSLVWALALRGRTRRLPD
jgi:uncharacterized membrane protein